MSRTTSFLKYWLPVLLWMALIFSGSSDLMSSRRTSRFIGPFLRFFKSDISEEAIQRVQFVVRKGGHVLEYAVLTLLAWRACARPGTHARASWRWSAAISAFLIAVSYAVTDEVHQSFVPSRQGHWIDVLWDSLGAALGLLSAWLFGRWRRLW